eukprot:119179_1
MSTLTALFFFAAITFLSLKGDKFECMYGCDKNDNIDVDIIFIHGLEGDIHDTWKNEENNALFPELLYTDNDIKMGLRIHSFGYDNAITDQKINTLLAWLFGKEDKSAIDLDERASTLLTYLRTKKTLNIKKSNAPIIFIVHSYGGLLIKSALLKARNSVHTKHKMYVRIYEKTAGIIFYATPHIGAHLASLLNKLVPSIVGKPISEMELLGKPLLDLNQEFIELQDEKEMQILCLYETKSMLTLFGTKVVDYGKCHGPDVSNAAMNDDHSSICKPMSHDDVRYAVARQYIEDIMERYKDNESSKTHVNPDVDINSDSDTKKGNINIMSGNNFNGNVKMGNLKFNVEL